MDDSRKYTDVIEENNFLFTNHKSEIGPQDFFANLIKNSLLFATDKLFISRKPEMGFSNHFDDQTKGKKFASKKYKNKPTYNASSSSSSDYDHLQSYNPFPLNLISFSIMLMLKCVSFQMSLFISFITFPIWCSNFCLMLVLFPFQTLHRVKDHTKQKLMKSCNSLYFMLTSFIYNRLKSQKTILKLAVRSTKAILCSVYVFFVLLAFLILGFVISGVVMRKLVEESVHTTETLNFDYTKTSPVAFVGFGLMGSDQPHVPYNHKLRVTVSLTLPESDYNMKLGIFQVRVESLSMKGDVIMGSSYPTMLRFKSQPVRVIQTFINSVPLIAGFQSEVQTLKIVMPEFTQGDVPTASFKVVLEQRAEFKSGSGVPEIYDGSLEIASELPQLKRMLWSWRRTVFVWMAFSIFVVQVVVFFVFCRPLVFPGGIGKGSKKKSWPQKIAWYKQV